MNNFPYLYLLIKPRKAVAVTRLMALSEHDLDAKLDVLKSTFNNRSIRKKNKKTQL